MLDLYECFKDYKANYHDLNKDDLDYNISHNINAYCYKEINNLDINYCFEFVKVLLKNYKDIELYELEEVEEVEAFKDNLNKLAFLLLRHYIKDTLRSSI